MRARFRSTLSILSALSLSLILASPDALAAQHGRTSVTIRNTPPRPMTPGSQLWVQHFHRGRTFSKASALAVSPDGSTVFATGVVQHRGHPRRNDYVTVAYDAATGATRWIARYNGPLNHSDIAYAIGVSPDGSKVFVTGGSARRGWDDYATVAYDAVTGTQLWAARYNGPGSATTTPTPSG
jgi:hypothetical protein